MWVLEASLTAMTSTPPETQLYSTNMLRRVRGERRSRCSGKHYWNKSRWCNVFDFEFELFEMTWHDMDDRIVSRSSEFIEFLLKFDHLYCITGKTVRVIKVRVSDPSEEPQPWLGWHLVWIQPLMISQRLSAMGSGKVSTVHTDKVAFCQMILLAAIFD